MKKLKISMKAMRALNKSIEHWKEVVESHKRFMEVHAKSDSCPLCHLYADGDDTRRACQGCPIDIDGETCDNDTSPWGQFNAGARKMLEYLEGLKSRSRVSIIKTIKGK
jgi:hypothetical protein